MPVPTTKLSLHWLNPKYQFELVDGKVIEYKKAIVHEFFVDEEQVVLAANEYLQKWVQSEMGQWVINHAVERPVWYKYDSPSLVGAKIFIVTKFKDKDLTFWQLKWGK